MIIYTNIQDDIEGDSSSSSQLSYQSSSSSSDVMDEKEGFVENDEYGTYKLKKKDLLKLWNHTYEVDASVRTEPSDVSLYFINLYIFAYK